MPHFNNLPNLRDQWISVGGSNGRMIGSRDQPFYTTRIEGTNLEISMRYPTYPYVCCMLLWYIWGFGWGHTSKNDIAKLRWSSLKNEIQTWWDGFGYVASIELDLYLLITCYIFWKPRNSIFTKACQGAADDGFSLSGSSGFVVPASFILFVGGK